MARSIHKKTENETCCSETLYNRNHWPNHTTKKMVLNTEVKVCRGLKSIDRFKLKFIKKPALLTLDKNDVPILVR